MWIDSPTPAAVALAHCLCGLSPALAALHLYDRKQRRSLHRLSPLCFLLNDLEQSAGLGLQLRVYRGVPLVSLNAIAPDKKVEVRPQVNFFAPCYNFSVALDRHPLNHRWLYRERKQFFFALRI